MKHLASPAALTAGCVVVIVINTLLLGGAWSNRLGEPVAELTLTERELAMPSYRQEENSALTLSLVMTHEPPATVRRASLWRRQSLPEVELSWLDRGKLGELGCRVDLDPSDPDAQDYYASRRLRRTWVVLELDGEAWERWIAEREEEVRLTRDGMDEDKLAESEALLALDRTMRSRLFPVDAGTDPAELRARYPERSRYAVVEALIRPSLGRDDDDAPVVRGSIVNLVTRPIHVPPGLGQSLARFRPGEARRRTVEREREQARSGWPPPSPPRYRADVVFGRRHEPWLVGVASGEKLDGS